MAKLTFNVKFRYSDERDFRLHACGIEDKETLREIVGNLAVLAGVCEIMVNFDLCETDFKIFCV